MLFTTFLSEQWQKRLICVSTVTVPIKLQVRQPLSFEEKAENVTTEFLILNQCHLEVKEERLKIFSPF